MCGIAAIWGNVDTGQIRQMMDCMVHRGPDAEGVFSVPGSKCVLGHRRLSIIDPIGGNQPILGKNSHSAIVANGEIYNFRSLRQGLAPTRFRTESDSETILRLYEEGRQDIVAKLDGMYAFVIADGDHLFAVRDPLGIKPLYVGKQGDSLCFASEIKALVGVAEEIAEFPPGTCFSSVEGYRRFYEVPEVTDESLPLRESVRRLRTSLERAVEKRLMSDVPVGAFLSGGLDSSVVAAIARRHMSDLHTFAVGVESSPDLEAARQVADYLGTVHHEYILTPDEVWNCLPDIVYHLESFDQDLMRSAIPCYFTAKLASDHVKVVLCGEGADELFGGYAYYKDVHNPLALAQELRRSVSSLHNINLQRVDRMTMAHGVEGRVPFLDLEMVEVAQAIPSTIKIRRQDDVPSVEKWVLRKAFEDLLPQEIVWREKEQFDEGSGTIGLLSEALKPWKMRAEMNHYAGLHPEARLRSVEESIYHKLLVDTYPDPKLVLKSVARWSDQAEAQHVPIPFV